MTVRGGRQRAAASATHARVRACPDSAPAATANPGCGCCASSGAATATMPRDLTVSFRFEGDFATAFLEGRPDGIMPGETLKTLVHETAREHAGAEIEALGLALCQRVLDDASGRSRACASRSPSSRGPAWTSAASRRDRRSCSAAPEQRTAAITSNGTQTAVVVGHRSADADADVRLPARAAPARAPDDGRDDAVQALLVGGLTARWTYSNADVTFGPYRQGVRAAIIETFAMHAGALGPAHALRDCRRRARHLRGDSRHHAGDARAPLPARRSVQRAGSRIPTSSSSRPRSLSASSK